MHETQITPSTLIIFFTYLYLVCYCTGIMGEMYRKWTTPPRRSSRPISEYCSPSILVQKLQEQEYNCSNHIDGNVLMTLMYQSA